MKKIIFILMITMAFIGCKKKTVTDTAACEKEGWGILKVNFGSTTLRHSVIVTIPGTSSFREKIIPAGQASDTLHLSGSGKYNGIAYPLSVSSLDNMGTAVDQKSDSRAIGNCNTTELSFTF